MEVRLGPSHIVLDGDPALPPKKGAQPPQFSAHAYCGQTAGWIKMPLGTMVGLGPGNIALDADPSTTQGAQSLPRISAHVCCGQTAGWIKMPLGTNVGLGPGHIVTWEPSYYMGTQLPPPKKKGAQPPNFRPMSIMAKRLLVSATAEHLLKRSYETKSRVSRIISLESIVATSYTVETSVSLSVNSQRFLWL